MHKLKDNLTLNKIVEYENVRIAMGYDNSDDRVFVANDHGYVTIIDTKTNAVLEVKTDYINMSKPYTNLVVMKQGRENRTYILAILDRYSITFLQVHFPTRILSVRETPYLGALVLIVFTTLVLANKNRSK